MSRLAVTILIPAAGASRRMAGADKLFRLVDGVPQLRRTALMAIATGAPVVVTIPAGDKPRRDLLAGLDAAIIEVPDHSEGMAASLRIAAKAIPPDEALMVLPADMPELVTSDLNCVLGAQSKYPHRILRGASGDIPGHPVVFPAELVPELQQVSGDAGGQSVVAAYPERLELVPLAADRAVRDLDTAESWIAWEAQRPKASHHDTVLMSMRAPLAEALCRPEGVVLAIITAIHGSSYRRIGTMMCFLDDGTAVGGLTNGCIEGDLSLHAAKVRLDGRPVHLLYGTGSPFIDIRLPCGGSIEVGLYPAPSLPTLIDVQCLVSARASFALSFGPDGHSKLVPFCQTGWQEGDFVVAQQPNVRFLVLGEGAEAITFSRLAHSLGYEQTLLSPFETTVDLAREVGCDAMVLKANGKDALLGADPRTAVVLFFHDHDREIPILATALTGPAFYVGAQGSRRVAERRHENLIAAGIDRKALSRIRAPIGLILSTRDARTLSISVMAEVLGVSEGPP